MTEKKNIDELESIITRAIQKVGASKENDLCKYLPMDEGGYMHHFTLKKMKGNDPSELSSMIKQYIIKPVAPRAVLPKPRAPRGSRKKRDQITFSKFQLERLLNIARLAGDKEMISILSPKKSLASIKRDLINNVKENRVDHELWNAYVETVNSQQSIMEAQLA